MSQGDTWEETRASWRRLRRAILDARLVMIECKVLKIQTKQLGLMARINEIDREIWNERT